MKDYREAVVVLAKAMDVLEIDIFKASVLLSELSGHSKEKTIQDLRDVRHVMTIKVMDKV